jgi:hypothetical protein
LATGPGLDWPWQIPSDLQLLYRAEFFGYQNGKRALYIADKLEKFSQFQDLAAGALAFPVGWNGPTFVDSE